MFKRILLASAAIASVLFAPHVQAQIVAHPLVYNINGKPFEGYMAQNEGMGKAQPMVILIHDWNGLDSYEKMRANMLSTQGYTVLAIDLYGQGVRPKNVEESRAESGKLYGNRPLMRERILAGLAEAKKLPNVNPENIVAIGYCFGGSSVLELARSGADLDGFVSFHGGLATPENEDYQAVQGPILILQGSEDPVSSMTDVANLAKSMTEAKVSYDMEIFGGARHAFTVWDGADYDAKADLQSWSALLTFLHDHLH